MVENKQKKLEFDTREYSVYISDDKKTSCGSGMLYYPGYGDVFYVFTCAHVLEGMQNVELTLLLPEKPERDLYKESKFTVPASQVAYYPLDKVADNVSGGTSHSHDVAVIPVRKPEQLNLKRSEYFVAEAQSGDKIFLQGFPGGRNEGEYLIEVLDVAYGTVLCNVPKKATFMLRLEDSFINAGDRVYEMEGFSGSSVWNCNEGKLCSYGLLSEGFREIYRAKLNTVKIEYIRRIMKNRFNVLMESKIPCIPETDVAESSEQFDGTLVQVPDVFINSNNWIDKRIGEIRAYIDDLKMQRAIDLCKQTISAQQFERCNADTQKRLMQHLLYCYEICLLEEEFNALEKEMNSRGLLNGHDPMRRMTRLFNMHEYEKTRQFAEEVLKDNPNNQVAKMFSVICKAYTAGAGEEETVRQFVDDRERLKINVQDKDTQSLIYQILGFVYCTHYHSHERAVRCLNCAYRISSDKMVLETLAMAYYFLAVKDAVDKDDKIIPEKIDRESLFKARECYLIVLEKADELFLKGTIRLAGLPLYNTFVFSNDFYRVLTLYPKLITCLKFSNSAQLRDIEMKYARIRCMEGQIDTSQFKALADTDKVLLKTLAEISLCTQAFEQVHSGYQVDAQLETMLANTISHTEKNLEQISDREELNIRVALINLYGKGILLFGWNVISDINRHYSYVEQSGNEKLIIAMKNFIFELEHPFEESVKIFRKSFEVNPSIETWSELRNLHIRHGKLDLADALYKELFLDYPQIYEKEPEFAFRSYIDFVIGNKRDIKDALQCFIATKNKFHDIDIAGFLELELMLYTSTFNNPERFEEERLSFVERGLIPKDNYHLNALAAFMCNLNEEKSKVHFESLNVRMYEKLPIECIHYLVWQKKLKPCEDSGWTGMIPDKIDAVTASYNNENWRSKADFLVQKHKFQLGHTLAVDAWTLYLLAESGNLELLNSLDHLYVSHSTVNRIMFEICHYPNIALHVVLEYLKDSKHVHIQSADFEHQLVVRNKVPYDEPASTVAIAKEVGCPAMIGEPKLSWGLVKSFANLILRPSDLNSILS